MLKHDSMGCEHLLLALVREERGRAALIFKSLNTTAERTRARVARTVGSAPEVASGDVAFTREAKRALGLSLHEAVSLNHRFVGPEHILLGLLRNEDGLATRSLSLSLLDVDAAQLAHAAKAIRIPPSSRLASMHSGHVAEFARLQFERRAAATAGDAERAAALNSRARSVGETIRSREHYEDPARCADSRAPAVTHVDCDRSCPERQITPLLSTRAPADLRIAPRPPSSRARQESSTTERQPDSARRKLRSRRSSGAPPGAVPGTARSAGRRHGTRRRTSTGARTGIAGGGKVAEGAA